MITPLRYNWLFEDDEKAVDTVEQIKAIMYGIATGEIKTPHTFWIGNVKFIDVTTISGVELDVSRPATEFETHGHKMRLFGKTEVTMEFSMDCDEKNVVREQIETYFPYRLLEQIVPLLADRLYKAPMLEPLVIPEVFNFQFPIRVVGVTYELPQEYMANGTPPPHSNVLVKLEYLTRI